MTMKASTRASEPRPIETFLFEFNYMQRPWSADSRARAPEAGASARSCDPADDAGDAAAGAAKAISEPTPRSAAGRLPKALRRD